ncbi:MAG: DUF481 domain-containing protein [Synechococcus sp.]
MLRSISLGLASCSLLASPCIALAAEPTVTVVLRNGDTITGVPVPEESTEDTQVLIHPQLGRLELSSDAIQPAAAKKRWSSSIAAGLNATGKDGDSTLSGNLKLNSTYKDEIHQLDFKAGANYSRSQDKGEPAEIKTKKGEFSLRYDRALQRGLGFFALSNYHRNALNDVGTDDVLASIGLSVPIVKTETTQLTLSAGPSLQWSGGGSDCATNEYCDNTYGGGTVTASLSWAPWRALEVNLSNRLSAAFASEIKPSNTFSAQLKLFPVQESRLFTSLEFQSIYQSMTTPTNNNTVTAQVGLDL